MNKKIRLLFYLPNIKDYQDRVLLIDNLASRIEKCILVVSKNDFDADALGVKNITIIEPPIGNGILNKSFLRIVPYIHKLLKKEKINIIHDTFGHLFMLFFKKSLYPNIKFVTSFYNIMYYDFYNYILPRYGWLSFLKYKDFRYWALRLIPQKMMAMHADAIIVQAPGLIQRINQSYDFCEKKVFCITNNITSNIWNVVLKKTQLKTTIHLLFVGGFSFGKGADLLIRFLKRCKENNIDAKATCVGSISPLDKVFLQKEIKTLGVSKNINFIKSGSIS